MNATEQQDKVWVLAELIDKLRWDRQVESSEPWPQIVHAHGCFDVLHVGHIRHLRQARQMGDLLVVTITGDSFVNKGEGRPVFDENLRAEAVAALECVDYVAVNRGRTAGDVIRGLRPALYVKGPECRDRVTAGLLDEISAVRRVGGDIRYTEGSVWSSSALIDLFNQGPIRER